MPGSSTCSACRRTRPSRSRPARRWPTSSAWRRHGTHVLAGVGWDVEHRGLLGAPPVHVLAGVERHDSVDLALRYLGFGAPTLVAADEEGRMRVDALAAALDAVPDGEAVIVVLQAGDLHSGAFDPFAELVPMAHARGAWVHVDGAFGLWAAATPRLAELVAGMADADSWATDAHKTLNVTYDCGIAAVAQPGGGAGLVRGPHALPRGGRPRGTGQPVRARTRDVEAGSRRAGVGRAALARAVRGSGPRRAVDRPGGRAGRGGSVGSRGGGAQRRRLHAGVLRRSRTTPGRRRSVRG